MSNEIYKTPRGRFKWVKVLAPSFKFSSDGEFSVDFYIDEDKAQTIIDLVEESISDKIKEHRKDKKKEPKIADKPYKLAEDGQVKMHFKQNYKVTKKDGTVIEFDVPVFDAMKDEWDKDVKIGNGSEGRVAYSIYTWDVPSMGVGATLRLKALQVIDHVSYSRDASDFGFGDDGEEDGFQGMGEFEEPLKNKDIPF